MVTTSHSPRTGTRADAPPAPRSTREHDRSGPAVPLSGAPVPLAPAPLPGPGGFDLEIGAPAGPWLVTHARRRVANSAVGFGASPDESLVVELLTSEILTNAVVHGAEHGHVTVRTALHDGTFSVAVIDDDPHLPVRRAPDAGDASGRGLWVIDNLATAWGIEPSATGKTVWFSLELAAGHDRPVRRA